MYRNLYSVAQIRELDRIVIKECGISGYELMQRAGRFSYETLKKTWPECNNITVICGCGNNAGDGYVLAKLAIEDGKFVRIVNCFDPKMLKGDAKRVYQDLLTLDPEVSDCLHGNPENIYGDSYDVKDELTREMHGSPLGYAGPNVFVDAIFGTGLTRDIHGELFEVIEVLNGIKEDVDIERKILSIDIPSGLNADTGSIMNVAVNADVTATFMGEKKGMYTQVACEYSGQIVFNDLDIPYKSYQQLGKPDCRTLDCHEKLNTRKRNSHKGDFGHVLVIGGDEGYLGASQMAAEAAMRVGSGLVSVATRKSHAAQLSIAVPEIMSHGVETLDELMPLIKRANVIAIGPGLGQSEWAKLLFARVLELDLPIIIDADGLNLLAEEEQSSQNWVITPHPGEAARLLKTDVTTIQSDRFQSARNLHTKYQGVVVLKGAGSIVTDLEGNLYVCNEGNPGMSTGGMGDVLTGVIAGLIAQGADIEVATQTGVLMHARAADMAASSGERGMMATDLMPYLRQLANPEQ
jgi:NAD(P)H-hydrate epimerase